MTAIGPEVFAYALAAGLSGTAFLAAVVILSTRRGVANAVAFLGGFAAVLAIAVAGAAFAVTLLTGERGERIVAVLVQLTLGLLLLSAAWRLRPGQSNGPDMSSKVGGMVAKLHGLHPAGAFSAGIGLAVLPKRLVITLLAGAAIGAGDVSAGQSLALAVMYVMVACALIWLPMAIYVLGGDRADRGLETAQLWLIENAGPVTFVAALVFGLLFTGQAVVVLLT